MRLFRKTSTALLAAILGLSGGLPATDFLRGDVDGSGRIAVSDAIRILAHLFQGDGAAVPCADAADTNDSGLIELADASQLLSGLFLGGPAPAAPFPACGEDPTEDALGCDQACPPASVYFGKEFRADGLIVVIDHGGAMEDSGELVRAKAETSRWIERLTVGVEFALIFFRAEVIAFPTTGTPAESTDEMTASAADFMRNAPRSGGNCVLPALLVALEFARKMRGRNPAVLYVSDGGGTCEGADEVPYLAEVLETVTTANAGIARIHTFQPGTISTLMGRRFLEQLAIRNGGTHTEAH